MSKYPNLYQIGEVAKAYSISRKMILNYERIGLIKPTYIDQWTKYRYFNSNDISKIGLIIELRKSGMSLPDIKKYFLKKISISNQIAVLEKQILSIKNTINQLKILNITPNSMSDISIIDIPEIRVCYKDIIAKDVDEAIKEFSNLYSECITNGYNLSTDYNNFCIFYSDLFSSTFFETENIKMRICMSLSNNKKLANTTVYPKSKVLSISYCGHYDKSYVAYEALIKYIIDNNIKVIDKARELYIEGGFSNKLDNNIIQIIIPIEI